MAVCESVCIKPAKLEGTIDLAAAFPLPLSTLLPKAEGGRERETQAGPRMMYSTGLGDIKPPLGARALDRQFSGLDWC